MGVSPLLSQEACRSSEFKKNEIIIKEDKCWYWETGTTSQGSLQDALAHKDSFHRIPNLYPNFGFSPTDVWFRFVIEHPKKKQDGIFLKLSNPNLDEFDLYQQTKTGKWTCIATGGDQRKMKAKKFPSRLPIIPITLNEMQKDSFLLRVNNGGDQFHFIPSFVEADYFLVQDIKDQLLFGIYLGLMFFIILFNLFSFIFLKEKTALWYSLYVIFLALFQWSLLGYGTNYFWPESMLVNHANPIFASASVLFLLYFCQDYLQTKILLPKIHVAVRVFKFLVFTCLILSSIPIKPIYQIAIVSINSITLLTNLFIISIAITAIRKKIDLSKLFLLAFSFLIISIFGFILKNFGFIPSYFIMDYGLQIGSALESILLSVGIVLKYKKTRDSALKNLQAVNEIREKTNQELEQKVQERTSEVENQKELLEIKNEEIISSIAYAKRIQEVILPSAAGIHHLLPKALWWYMPKDIVAGDFYWVNQTRFNDENWTLFAVADCTGHGVPGAMMSVMCVNALNSSLKDLSDPDPGLLLEKVASYLSDNLTSDDTQLADGMDVSLVFMNPRTQNIYWSGANNPLWILRDKQVIQYEPTKRPVGKSEVKTPFKTNFIELKSSDRLFLFSDGYVDQFGGIKNKKFKRINLIRIIEENADLLLPAQLSKIQSAFFDWKREEDQVDDVCLFMLEI